MPIYLGEHLITSGNSGGGVPPLIAEKWWLDESIPLEDRKKIFRRMFKKESFTIVVQGALSKHYVFILLNQSGTIYSKEANNVKDLDHGYHLISIIPANILD